MAQIFNWKQRIWEIKFRFVNFFFIQLWMFHSYCIGEYPQLIKGPRDLLFASSIYDPISINFIMSPSAVKFVLLIRISDSSQTHRYHFQTLFNSSKHSSKASSSMDILKITSVTQTSKSHNRLYVNITLSEWLRLQAQPFHIKIISNSGAILSPPVRIQIYHLSRFNESGTEYVEFLMGNIAQILCSLPFARPSPPKIKFHHNSNLINISNSSRYKLVEFPPLYNKVALLIRNLVEDDSGSYKCIAYFPHTKLYQISRKTTLLTVKEPKNHIPIRFLLSSHYNMDNSKIIHVKVPEGVKLVLYCIYESAPIDEISWFWSKNDRKYDLDPSFGTLTIEKVGLRDNSDISCMNNEDKIFRIHVYQKPKLIAKPNSVVINKQNLNKNLVVKCEYSQKSIGNQKINWLFNGDVLVNNEKVEITNHSLVIRRLSRQHQGIYQCWSEIKSKWFSDKIVVHFPVLNKKEKPVFSQKIVEVEEGNSLDLRCDIPMNYDTYRTTVKWFKENSTKEMLNNNFKMTKFEDIENNQFVLKIKYSQLKAGDNYICKIFLREDRNVLIKKTFFKLIFKKRKKHKPIADPVESTQETSNIFKISKPNVILPEEFLLAVNVTWSLTVNIPDVNQSKIVNHYRVEYKQGSPRYRPLRWRSSIPIINWSNATIIDKSFTTVNCLIHSPQILKPQYWYSFRALGIPNSKYVQLTFPRKNIYFSRNFFDEIRSPWSDPINFEHIMPFKPKITNITILNSGIANIAWIYSPLSETFNYQAERNIEFKILYRILPSEITVESLKSMNDQIYDLFYLPELQSNDISKDRIEVATKISAYHGEWHELNLTNLKPNIQYIVALYAIHRPISGMSKMYTALSEPYLMDTVSFKNYNPVISNSHDRSSKNQTNTHSNYFRNKILFLVLGSLAGILFVIALFMFIMCLWYQIRYHSKKRQNISSGSSVKTSSANTFAPIGIMNQIPNNSVFITSSNIVSPQGMPSWTKSNRFPTSSEYPHLYLAQHLSLWSPNHLAQFNLPNNLQPNIVNESKIKKSSVSPTTLSTPSPKSNIDIEINNLDGSIEDSQEESVRLLDYQTHSSCFKREDQCTLNNAFSVRSEGRDRQNDQDASSDNTRSISHYPFSPSALELYSHKKKSKLCSSNRKDLTNIKINLKQPKLQNSNYFLPIRSRLSCFFPSAPSGESPPSCTPVIASLCKENSLNQYNLMKKDETFAEHPFLATDSVKNGFINNFGNGSFKYQYSPSKNVNNQKVPSKFVYDPIHDLQPHEYSRSNSTAASARQFLFSLYPDGVRPCINNIDLDKQTSNSQTNL